jgi:hypothetical protein
MSPNQWSESSASIALAAWMSSIRFLTRAAFWSTGGGDPSRRDMRGTTPRFAVADEFAIDVSLVRSCQDNPIRPRAGKILPTNRPEV